MTSLRTLLGITAPTEARFFQFVGAFGLAAAAVYWFISYETAGTVLLLAFGGAAGLVGLVLAGAAPRPASGARGAPRTRPEAPPPEPRPEDAHPQVIAPSPADDIHAGRPYLDESGRIPSPTLAPFAVGVGISVAATSVVFGPAPLLVGAVPALWGLLAWLHGARSEFDAVDRGWVGPPRDGPRDGLRNRPPGTGPPGAGPG